MKCNRCGMEFEEGIFCPECGNRIDMVYNDESNVRMYEKEYEKAHQIINEYKSAEEEKNLILGLKWPDSQDVDERISKRIEVYRKAKSMNVQTKGAQQILEQMRGDIENDYNEMKKKDGSLGAQIFWACVFTFLAINFLLPLGIIGIIIGILVIYAGWRVVFELKKAKARLKELDAILKQLNLNL